MMSSVTTSEVKTLWQCYTSMCICLFFFNPRQLLTKKFFNIQWKQATSVVYRYLASWQCLEVDLLHTAFNFFLLFSTDERYAQWQSKSDTIMANLVTGTSPSSRARWFQLSTRHFQGRVSLVQCTTEQHEMVWGDAFARLDTSNM